MAGLKKLARQLPPAREFTNIGVMSAFAINFLVNDRRK
jgi:hypothetical protein